MRPNCNTIAVKKIHPNTKNILQERKGKRTGDIHAYFAYCACAYPESELSDRLMISFPSNCCDLVPVLISHSIAILMSYSICCDRSSRSGPHLSVYRLQISWKRLTDNSVKKRRAESGKSRHQGRRL